MDRPLLIDSRTQFMNSLVDTVAPFVLSYLQTLYAAAVKQHRGAATLAFQRALREVPGWNASTIEARTEEIRAKCPWLTNLIAAVIVTNVKILSSVKLHDEKPNINLKLPTDDLVVHKVYVNVAREVYTKPALLTADNATRLRLVHAAVEQAVRSVLPMQEILEVFMGKAYDASEHAANPGEMSGGADGDEPDGPGDGPGPGLDGDGLDDGFDGPDGPAGPGIGAGFGADGEDGAAPFMQFPDPPAAAPPAFGQPATGHVPAQPAMQPAMQPTMAQAMPTMGQATMQPTMGQAPSAQPAMQPAAPPAVPPTGGLFGEDTAKQISLGAHQLRPRPAPGGHELFPDADDEF